MQAELQTALFQAFDTLNLQRVKTFSVPPVTLCGLGALGACGQEATNFRRNSTVISLTMCWRFPGKPVFVKASMNATIGSPMSAVCKKSQPTKQTF